MSSLNKVILIGLLGRDPEIRYNQNGDPIANFSLATTEKWKAKDGTQSEQTEWHRVVVFGGLAKVVSAYFMKGLRVYVEGKLKTRKWTDSNGVEKFTTEIVIDGFNGSLLMLSDKKSQNNTEHAQQKANAYQPEKQFDDEAPF